jgi:hypothetical protein
MKMNMKYILCGVAISLTVLASVTNQATAQSQPSEEAIQSAIRDARDRIQRESSRGQAVDATAPTPDHKATVNREKQKSGQNDPPTGEKKD